jgi:hypothetical protein
MDIVTIMKNTITATLQYSLTNNIPWPSEAEYAISLRSSTEFFADYGALCIRMTELMQLGETAPVRVYEWDWGPQLKGEFLLCAP